MDNTQRHRDLQNFGHLMNVGETNLDHLIGHDIYVRREPEDLPEYTIMYNGVSVRREIHWDTVTQEVIFHDNPERRTIKHTQKTHSGSIAYRTYSSSDDFGMPVRPENVVEITC